MTSPWFLVYQVEEEDEDKLGEGLHVFFKWTNGYAISNLNQPNWTPQRFKHLSVSIVCGAIEQELRDQGEVVRRVVIIIIIMTFIYTAQIQLYSFQMRLTIKDLKIYLTLKDPKIYREKKLQH